MTRKPLRQLPIYLEPQQVEIVLQAVEAFLADENNDLAMQFWGSLTLDQLELLEKAAAKLRFLNRVAGLSEKGGRK